MTIGRPEDTSEPREGVVLTPEQAKSRRARNIAIGVAVALFVALFYFVTIVKLGGNVVPRAG
ncbi:hypothetical protein A1351_05690 [Methylosinus sp. R-45379]|jgi:hypothetical protein|uniref:hypothetical protein n=1 Tax=unclassified Methylosinus TaxID=2624500 RepID=UPI000467B83D|nr:MULTISPECIES: hypothetical protein [unclassified Methylosinus]OAI31356.1 hypothetical protein A1351_05690 [Methylosinus sp. R-45379]TDX62216.1 hypothetical protein EDE12_111123 [Methylosinus sp. sav-2]